MKLRSLILAFMFAPLVAHAQGTAVAKFTVPELTSPVMDLAHMIDPRSTNSLNFALRHLLETSGTQFTVLTLPDMGGLTIEQVGIQVADQWKLGKKGTAGSSDSKLDRGALLIVAVQEHKVRIEVGRGLEGVLTDIDCNDIITNKIAPFLRGNPGQGIILGISEMAAKTDPDVDLKPYLGGPTRMRRHREAVPAPDWFRFLFWGIWLLYILFRIFGRRRGFFFWGGGGWGSGGGSGWGGGGGWSGGGGGFNGGGSSGDW